MNITVKNIQYHPNAESVAILCEHAFGAFFVTTTQSALNARVTGDVNWGDVECLAEAQASIAAQWPDQVFVVQLPSQNTPDAIPVTDIEAPVFVVPTPLPPAP